MTIGATASNVHNPVTLLGRRLNCAAHGCATPRAGIGIPALRQAHGGATPRAGIPMPAPRHAPAAAPHDAGRAEQQQSVIRASVQEVLELKVRLNALRQAIVAQHLTLIIRYDNTKFKDIDDEHSDGTHLIIIQLFINNLNN